MKDDDRRKVCQGKDYASALSTIIQRDYFTDIERLQSQLEDDPQHQQQQHPTASTTWLSLSEFHGRVTSQESRSFQRQQQVDWQNNLDLHTPHLVSTYAHETSEKKSSSDAATAAIQGPKNHLEPTEWKQPPLLSSLYTTPDSFATNHHKNNEKVKERLDMPPPPPPSFRLDNQKRIQISQTRFPPAPPLLSSPLEESDEASLSTYYTTDASTDIDDNDRSITKERQARLRMLQRRWKTPVPTQDNPSIPSVVVETGVVPSRKKKRAKKSTTQSVLSSLSPAARSLFINKMMASRSDNSATLLR